MIVYEQIRIFTHLKRLFNNLVTQHASHTCHHDSQQSKGVAVTPQPTDSKSDRSSSISDSPIPAISDEQLARLGGFGVSDCIPLGGNETIPRYTWRGVLLDSARTFWPVGTVCELLALMARYRLNKLHWHLCDDAGWRFKVDGYPDLTTVGASLEREPFAWYTNVDPAKAAQAYRLAPNDSTCGYYTDEELRFVVKYAASLGIDVIPEVDLPGHMGAAIRAYPHLGDPLLSELPAVQWTHRNDVLWPSQQALDFIHAALDKVMDIFPSNLVHIGADEVNFAAWEADASLLARAAKRGVYCGAQIQGGFIRDAREYLARRGRRLAVWDDALQAQANALGGDEVITAWQENGAAERAGKSGHDWIFADSAALYLNRVAGPVDSEPAGMYGAISTGDILNLSIPKSKHLLGVQAAIWCEFVPNRDALYYQLFPRLFAVAQIAWSDAHLSWRDFYPLLEKELDWLAGHGINTRPLDAHTYRVFDPVERNYHDAPIDRHQAPEAIRFRFNL
ncbi:family 20 glycosylhydrolase [Mobiluncus porci]|nr:family 20 glycosylhydrolase [Mobiluncus porci]